MRGVVGLVLLAAIASGCGAGASQPDPRLPLPRPSLSGGAAEVEPSHWERAAEEPYRRWQDDLPDVGFDVEDDAAMLAEARCSVSILNATGVEITAASVIVLGYWSEMAYGSACAHWEVVNGGGLDE